MIRVTTMCHRWLARTAVLLLLALSATGSAPASADEAEEAEAHFRAGADRYHAGDFRGALLHFLASNRLAPNANVLFNVGRCYEQLGEWPNAWRYYSLALEATPEGGPRGRVAESLARVAPRVAILEVTSEPPGAVVYLDRRELGARGTTPTRLGLPGGTYRVLVELPGHETVEARELQVEVGQTVGTHFRLTAVLGRVSIAAGPGARGAEVRLDGEHGPVLGRVPVTLSLPPGRQRLFVTREGYRTTELAVDVVARGRVRAEASLAPLTGSLMVTTDLPAALIEIDGKPAGFSPAVVTVPRGRHRVRVKLTGFKEWLSEVEVAADRTTRLDVALAGGEQVAAASRVDQTVAQAPASVSVRSREELSAMAYPTIAEALRGTRGVYLSDDRSYTTLGFRGFSRPGDYGNKILILQDGHPTNDNILGQSFPGFEGRVDLGDVERIEVVRGPGSALYGTGAFFGVVNLVTRGLDEGTGGEVSVGTVEQSGGRGRIHGRLRLGPDASAWASAAYARSPGRTFTFPEYRGDPAAPDGVTRGTDGFHAVTTQGRLRLTALTVSTFWHRRDKQLPTGEYETLFNDPRARFVDERGFVEARFEPRLSETVRMLLRAHGNVYVFRAVLPYAEPPVADGTARERYLGRWVGVEQRVEFEPAPRLRFTLGGEAQRHLEASMAGQDSAGPYLRAANNPYTTLAAYTVAELPLGAQTDLSAGARADLFRWEYAAGTESKAAVSPRLALITRPYASGVFKVLGGSAFRAPSVYELFYQAQVQRQSPDLSPERVLSGEMEHTHRFTPRVRGTVAVYANWVTGLVVSRGAGTDTDPLYFENSQAPVLGAGVEAEAVRELRDGWLASLGGGVQRSRYVGEDAAMLRQVPNAHTLQLSARGQAPLLGESLRAAGRVTLETGRADRHDQAGDPRQRVTPPTVVWDLVFTGQLVGGSVHWNLGVYDVLDARQLAPVSREFRMTTVPGAGRTFHAQTTIQY